MKKELSHFKMFLPHRMEVYFICELCNYGYKRVNTFLEHKRRTHWSEYKKRPFLVFKDQTSEYNYELPSNAATGEESSKPKVSNQAQVSNRHLKTNKLSIAESINFHRHQLQSQPKESIASVFSRVPSSHVQNGREIGSKSQKFPKVSIKHPVSPNTIFSSSSSDFSHSTLAISSHQFQKSRNSLKGKITHSNRKSNGFQNSSKQDRRQSSQHEKANCYGLFLCNQPACKKSFNTYNNLILHKKTHQDFKLTDQYGILDVPRQMHHQLQHQLNRSTNPFPATAATPNSSRISLPKMAILEKTSLESYPTIQINSQNSYPFQIRPNQNSNQCPFQSMTTHKGPALTATVDLPPFLTYPNQSSESPANSTTIHLNRSLGPDIQAIILSELERAGFSCYSSNGEHVSYDFLRECSKVLCNNSKL